MKIYLYKKRLITPNLLPKEKGSIFYYYHHSLYTTTTKKETSKQTSFAPGIIKSYGVNAPGAINIRYRHARSYKTYGIGTLNTMNHTVLTHQEL
jgi:hypothetical protein